ncbi:MAG: haloacid dehalogenase-like hydrolase [Kiritimatiellales bacterium]|nr:haloacid dehalogenase-like hydrolase [Kiritimatiellales bacterium]
MSVGDRYIFCDIDGTLLYARGAGRDAFAAAFESAFNIPIDISHINFAGATDIRVLAQLMREQQIAPDPALEQGFFDCLPPLLDRFLVEQPPTVFPGVGTFLEKVSNHWKLGLVTGNIRSCAYIKLRHAGIGPYFSDIGGFGDDDGDRARMAALALERAGNPSGSFLLGDTPSDIHAARVNGITSVAVCNGQFDRATLTAEGADIVVDSFEDADELFQALEV